MTYQMGTYTSSGSICVLQRFVKSKGPFPFINRVVWRVDKPSYAWTITSRTQFKETNVEDEHERFVVDTQGQFTCSIIQVQTGKNVDDCVKYIVSLVKFLEPNMALKFTEMVCDFVKDESEIWWMI